MTPYRVRIRTRKALWGAGGALALSVLILGLGLADLAPRTWFGLAFVPEPLSKGTVVSLSGAAPPGKIIFSAWGGPAWAAGLATGDQVLAIEGVPVRELHQAAQLLQKARTGEPLLFKVQIGTEEKTVRLARQPIFKTPQLWIILLTSLVSALAFVGIGGLVYWKRPDDLRAELFLTVSSLTTSLYLIYPPVAFLPTDALGALPQNPFTALYALCLVALGLFGPWYSAALLHLCLVFPKPLPLISRRPFLATISYKILPLSLAVCLPAFLAGWSIDILFSAAPWAAYSVFLVTLVGALVLLAFGLRFGLKNGWTAFLLGRPGRATAFFGPLFPAGIAGLTLLSCQMGPGGIPRALVGFLSISPLLFSCLGLMLLVPVLGCISLFVNYTLSDAEEKQQIRWPLWGIFVALASSVLFSLLNVGLGRFATRTSPIQTTLLDLLPKLFFLAIPASFAIGILKYRLMDIDLIIRKTAIYALVTGLVVGLFLLLAGGVGGLIVGFTGITDTFVVIAATLISTLALVPLRNKVQTFVDRRFFRSRFDYPTALARLEGELVEAGTDRTPLLQRTVRVVQETLRSRAAIAFLRMEHDGGFRAVAETEAPTDKRSAAGLAPGQDLIARLDDKPIVCRTEIPEEEARSLRKLGLEWFAAVGPARPPAAVLAVGRTTSGQALDQDDLEFLAAAARLLGETLDRISLKQQRQDLALAREIQKRLLPQRLPALPGVAIATAWHPSRQVGGDYFDIWDIGDGQLGFAIADVSGKGMPAALLMSNLQAACKALVGPGLTPDGLCRRLNEILCGHVAENRFITFFAGCFNPKSGLLVTSNAGHLAPILLRQGGDIRRLTVGGPVLGILKEADYEHETMTLDPGERLVLFTDGLTEAQTPTAGDFFGEDRLLDILKRADHVPLEGLAQALVEAAREFAGGEPQDDLTLVILGFDPTV